eukprot:CAMPEP_0168720208 /NCGR_PEP_ID=MMETSP0724-20121128/1441_1 /TAXON_ID=265536 /ORGANISM="Amphiprora sp., Strain CCMP467" /LENGTH=650 /DNA_ID=CAMNT_0008766797 /DNA_START=157 /DNA_END=2109 /DNA_ORIENTATION=+
MLLSVKPLLEESPATKFGWGDYSQGSFVDQLDHQKCVLIRCDEKPLTVEEFGLLVVGFNLTPYPYVGGAAPRSIIPVSAGEDIVFTANESPPSEPIPFHHELAQTPNPPEYVFFYCDTPAQEGGETPIIDSTLVYRYAMENFPEFMQKLLQHGARYIRTLPAEDDPTSPIGRSYKNTWHVKSPEELDEKLSKTGGCSWKWNDDGSVRVTSEPVPAVRFVQEQHEQNHVYQHTFANSVVAAFLGWEDSRNDRREALRFGNMDKMPDSVLESIANFMQQHRILHKWQKGDVMAINNQLVMHSRNPFNGVRKVFASIWGPPIVNPGIYRPEKSPAALRKPLMPQDPLVFGFWKVPKEVCADSCYNAIKAGYRRLDCACDYGNEKEVGEGLARAFKDGLCKRKDLFITSKLWNTYHKKEHVPLAMARTLQDLQLNYLDEYLIHFPITMEFVPFEDKYPPEWHNLQGKMVVLNHDIGETWKAMESLQKDGKCKEIGVCNFSTQLLRQLLSGCEIRPSTLQIELHPENTQQRLVRFAKEQGMRVTAFSIFGATSYVELGGATMSESLMNNATVAAIAKYKNKTPAQILVRWACQRGTLPLCKSSKAERMVENRNIFDFYLTKSEVEKIDTLDRSRRYNDPGDFCEAAFGTYCPIYE